MSEAEDRIDPGLWSLLLVGLVAGLLSGALGVGGGIVMVPLMVGVLHFDQHRAHATSLAAIVLIALAGAIRFAVGGEVDVTVGIAIGLGGVVGSTLGAHLMHRLSPDALKGVFGTLMILVGIRMVIGGTPNFDPVTGTVAVILVAVGVGLIAGVASGVAGIGGGVIMVPAMVFLLGLGQHAAEGTSLLAILFTAVAGTRVNVRNQRVDLKQSTVIGLGGIVSAVGGASIALLIDASSLTRVFGAFVGVVGVRMIVRLVRSRGVGWSSIPSESEQGES
ncbi:MAG: TSUP family transporter [Acidimicrobiia bacterium]|nr:TSUP family transporter [Acidimicrobiia bacterium]